MYLLVCGATFYHSGSILLLRTRCVWQVERNANRDHIGECPLDTRNDEFLPPKLWYDQIWHARELGGISTSNASHANWVNQLQPLYIAGQVFSNCTDTWSCSKDGLQDDNEYPAEKIALLKQLAKIERDTGWKTSSRAAELRKLWGFE